jgi:hypothetical protein
MKLYTEEQVKQIQQAILCNHKDAIMDENYCLNVTTPIELPSDEEIGEIAMAVYGFKATSVKDVLEYKAFKRGARLIMNKIQGGNNE